MENRIFDFLDRMSEERFGLALTIPTLVALGVIIGYPLVYNILLSLSKTELSRGALQISYAGIQNYRALVRDVKFWNAFKNMLVLTTTAVGTEFGLGLLLALALNKKLKGRVILQGLFILPMMIAPVTIGLLWRWMYSEEYGVINYILNAINLDQVHWLSAPEIALFSLAIVDIWQMFPFVMAILLAGLKMLPPESFEAAKIDGASGWQMFWHLTVPLLKPLLLMVLLIRTTDIFRIFDTVYVLTGGGPGSSTEVLATLMYRVSFTFLNFGKGSAISLISVGLSIALGSSYVKILVGARRI